jgi:hypothetical protein
VRNFYNLEKMWAVPPFRNRLLPDETQAGC